MEADEVNRILDAFAERPGFPTEAVRNASANRPRQISLAGSERMRPLFRESERAS